jgi:uncharacterized phage protein (TIGR02218 family)
MQSITPALAVHLAQEVTTLATCWKISRTDGAVLCLTDHDQDVVVSGETYLAGSGVTPSAVSSQLGLAVDNLELDGLLRSDGLQETDLLAGRYDKAAIEIFLVNYQQPEDGRLLLKSGWLGEVRLKNGSFSAEVRGISSLLQQAMGEVYTATCRAKLGDGRCKVNLATYTVSGVVTEADSAYAFTDSGRGEAKDHFSYGQVTFTSGANAGLTMEVRSYAGGYFQLFLPLPQPIAAGDHYSVVAGCDKRFESCASRFANAINFRGEPHVPGTDKLLETSATRSSP